MKSILYVIDALRADHLSCYGYERQTSPEIDTLAENSCLFENAYAQATWTRSSAATILTGLYPPTVGLTEMDDPLPENVPTITDVLPEEVKTLCVSSMGNVSSTFGFDRCFDEFIDLYRDSDRLEEDQRSDESKMFEKIGESGPVFNPTAADINDVLLPWVEKNANEDFFILVWSIDPHDPYEPTETSRCYSADQEYDRVDTYQTLTDTDSNETVDWIIDRYDDLIRQNDKAIGNLMEKLQELRIYKETMLGITGDHGEAFGEHGVFGHATAPFEEVIHVPLIFKFPAELSLNGTVSNTVEHVDIMPTILDAWDLEIGRYGQGETLVPITKGDAKSNGTAFSYTNLRATAPEFVSLRRPDWKLIQITPPVLRDVLDARSISGGLRSWYHFNKKFGFTRDKELLFPVENGQVDEEVPLRDGEQEVSSSFKEALEEIYEECSSIRTQFSTGSEPKVTKIDDETREQLEEMGYL